MWFNDSHTIDLLLRRWHCLSIPTNAAILSPLLSPWTWLKSFIRGGVALKERYIIGMKQKSWRPQIYIKLTRSNDDDSRKHPLKYFCLKSRIWWEINNLISRLEFIAQWAFFPIFFWGGASMQWKNVIGFSLFSRDPDGRLISNFYRFVSIWWIT